MDGAGPAGPVGGRRVDREAEAAARLGLDAERTRDCPCHGGRYTMDGENLTGPPSKPLERVDLSDG